MLTCIRGGKEMTTQVTLGEQRRQPPVFAFPGSSADLPMDLGVPNLRSLRPPMFQFPFDDQAKWTEFESMTITQTEEGRFKAEIKYRHEEKELAKSFEGSRQEIREAVQADEELPEKVKAHLLSSLTEMPNGFWNGNLGQRLRAMERELFDWPHRDF